MSPYYTFIHLGKNIHTEYSTIYEVRMGVVVGRELKGGCFHNSERPCPLQYIIASFSARTSVLLLCHFAVECCFTCWALRAFWFFIYV